VARESGSDEGPRRPFRCGRRRVGDRGDDIGRPQLDLEVGKSQNPEPLSAQPSIALDVVLAVLVKGTIGFNDQAMAQAQKIDDIPSDRNLAAEFQSFQTAVAQQAPKGALALHRRMDLARARSRLGGL